MTLTQFTIPRRHFNRLIDLALLPYESSFLLRAQRDRGTFVYLDTPVIIEGKANNTSPTFVRPEDAAIRKESQWRGYALIEGHTHPEQEGAMIRPYSCGWTLPRTIEFRDYRDGRLRQTPEGQVELAVRRALLNKMALEERQDERQKLLEQLIEGNQRVLVANMVTLNGVHYYISNRVRVHKSAADRADIADELRDDVCLKSGDFQGYQAMKDFSRDATALVHAHPDHVNTRSSRRKFMLSVLLLEGSGYEGAKPISVRALSD